MLTDREKEILLAIIKYIDKNEYVPTVREICGMVDVSSTSTVHGYLERLEGKGYIERNRAMPRAMKVIKS